MDCQYNSIAAIIISIVALANVAPTQDINFDYLGAVIGVLSFLVTLLIGYQIYTVINVKEELKEVQVVEAIKEFIPNFEHEEKGKNLDQKM